MTMWSRPGDWMASAVVATSGSIERSRMASQRGALSIGSGTSEHPVPGNSSDDDRYRADDRNQAELGEKQERSDNPEDLNPWVKGRAERGLVPRSIGFSEGDHRDIDQREHEGLERRRKFGKLEQGDECDQQQHDGTGEGDAGDRGSGSLVDFGERRRCKSVASHRKRIAR